MQVSPIKNCNYNYNNNKYQPNFTANLSNSTGTGALKSKLLEPFDRFNRKLVDAIKDHYYKPILDSSFIKWFAKKSDKFGDATKHMMVIGSTIISGMYVVRTLQNDNLDKEKRKTLAINDALTWALSTIGAFSLDNSLNKMWEGQTRKYMALYIKKHTNPEFLKKFEEKEAAKKAEMEKLGQKYERPFFDYTDLANKCKDTGVTAEDLNKDIFKAAQKRQIENYKIDMMNKAIREENHKSITDYLINKCGYTAEQLKEDETIYTTFKKYIHKLRKTGGKLPEGLTYKVMLDKLPEIKDARSFNTEILKFKPLSDLLKGFGAMKSILIFGLMYRYIVPVLVMKPANKLGNYIHQKKLEKQQAE